MTMQLNYHNANFLITPSTLLWTCLIVSCCITLTVITPSEALTCFCDHCPNGEQCTTEDHRDSRCFKSVVKVLENNTYFWDQSHGCLSGSDTNLGALQCQTASMSHKEPAYINCCKDEDFCNKYLPSPTGDDDPRWDIDNPPPPTEQPGIAPPSQLNPWPIAVVTALVTLLCVFICCTVYKISTLMYATYWANIKSNNLDSQDSVRSFKVNFDEHLKSHFASHHHNTSSSSASTHTYTISDYLSQKPGSPHDYEHSIASMEHTSTLPDMTSGIGTNVLQPRTIAGVVACSEIVQVGRGRFGRVFSAPYHGEDVAVKAFHAMDYESWRREEEILKKLNHENIVRFIASETRTIESGAVETWMFLEFCPYGSLCDFLDRNEICGPQQAIQIVLSIIRGLSYLHEDYTTGTGGYKPPIAHRDIKSKNILMRSPEICCLADFGHAVFQVNEETLDFGGYDRIQVGTIRYMAPEVLTPSENFDPTQFYTFAQADLYQFGLVLWEICHRTALDVLHPGGPHLLPYDGKVPQNPGIEDMIQLVCKDNYRPPRPVHWERHGVMKVLSSLMVECWRSNPKARMETLGVKKRIKELYDQAIPPQSMFYHNNLLDNFSINPNFTKEKDKSRSTEYTL
uniref:receptor protein serine/threonine kinase n=1 Tax=Aceria tosichella TaxID=561515 RepID=A0A6G1SCG8_9ACAR